MESFRSEFLYKKKGFYPLDHNLHPRITSYQRLQEAGDLKKFAAWVVNSKDSDYLNRNEY
jgi:hypothetical protein